MESEKTYTGRARLLRKRAILAISISAVFVALAVALEVIFKAIPFLQLPQGGSLSLSCLPLMLSSLTLGPAWGTVSGALYGLLNFLIDGYAFSWGSFIFDYVLAFAFMGLAGIFSRYFLREKILGFILGAIVAMIGRYLSHCISGAFFFADYAPEGVSAIFYSFILYNAPYCFGSLALDLAVGAAVFYPYQRLLSVDSIHFLFSPLARRGYANAASRVLEKIAEGSLDQEILDEAVKKKTISPEQAKALGEALSTGNGSDRAVEAVTKLWSRGGRYLPSSIKDRALSAAKGQVSRIQ